jgi:malate dehydrogenase (oxaloacetate-decarboxylating)(NADP+)
VLCFPYIFRGALDVGATTITREMEIAAVHAIAGWRRTERHRRGGLWRRRLSFGPQYLIPKPFDPRLIVKIAPAVAKAAIEGGVATRPIADLDAYVEQLQQFVYHSGAFMKPLFAAARQLVRDGASAHRVRRGRGRTRAARGAGDRRREARASDPDRPPRGAARASSFGLRLRLGQDVEVTNPEYDERFRSTGRRIGNCVPRRHLEGDGARRDAPAPDADRRDDGALGDADGMICGTVGAITTTCASSTK